MYYQLQDRVMALLGCDAKRWQDLGAYQMRHIQHEEDAIVDDIIPVRLYSQSAERETFDTDIVRHNFLSAIVTDPPYGRREKAQETRGLLEESDALAFATSKHMGDPREITSLLFMMARRLVRKGGRLVFWYPTEANVEGEVIIRELEEIETRSRQEQDEYELRLVRVTADKLHDKMWRWLVVYEVRERERG
jgi:tRNA G10  N-methylase Trm11